MKANKLALILGLFLLPVLINAQENKTQQASENVNRIITQANENDITFGVPKLSLDSSAAEDVKTAIEQERQAQIDNEVYNKGLSAVKRWLTHNCITPITEEQFQKLVPNLIKFNGDKYQFIPNDIICDTQYLYALHTYYEYDEGTKYILWQIKQYLISSGKLVDQSDPKKGERWVGFFEELNRQKASFVGDCELAKKAFSAMDIYGQPYRKTYADNVYAEVGYREMKEEERYSNAQNKVVSHKSLDPKYNSCVPDIKKEIMKNCPTVKEEILPTLIDNWLEPQGMCKVPNDVICDSEQVYLLDVICSYRDEEDDERDYAWIIRGYDLSSGEREDYSGYIKTPVKVINFDDVKEYRYVKEICWHCFPQRRSIEQNPVVQKVVKAME